MKMGNQVDNHCCLQFQKWTKKKPLNPLILLFFPRTEGQILQAARAAPEEVEECSAPWDGATGCQTYAGTADSFLL